MAEVTKDVPVTAIDEASDKDDEKVGVARAREQGLAGR
jgi:hypothetical protein